MAGGIQAHSLRHPFDSAEADDQCPGKPYQSAGRHNLGNVVEGTLPTDVLRLFLLAQFGHIDTVRSHIVRGAAKGYHRQQADAYRKEYRQLQRKRHQGKAYAGNYLRQHHKEFLGLEHLEERTPQELQRPRHHNERCPQGNLRITDAQSLEHKH